MDVLSGPSTPSRPVASQAVQSSGVSGGSLQVTQTPIRRASSGTGDDGDDERTYNIQTCLSMELKDNILEEQDEILLGDVSRFKDCLKICQEQGLYSADKKGWMSEGSVFGDSDTFKDEADFYQLTFSLLDAIGVTVHNTAQTRHDSAKSRQRRSCGAEYETSRRHAF